MSFIDTYSGIRAFTEPEKPKRKGRAKTADLLLVGGQRIGSRNSGEYRAWILSEYKKLLQTPKSAVDIQAHFKSLGYKVSRQGVHQYLQRRLAEDLIEEAGTVVVFKYKASQQLYIWNKK